MTEDTKQSSEALLSNTIDLPRRHFMKVAGAAGAIVGGLGGIGEVAAEEANTQNHTMTPAHDPEEMSETLVDVEDGEEVSGIIEDISDGERLVFPEGEFQWSRSVGVTADNWGIVGQPHDGTVFMVPEGNMGEEFPTVFTFRTAAGSSLTGEASDNILLKNLTFDSTGRANPGIRLGVRTCGHVENLHYRCNGTIGSHRMSKGMNAFVQSEDGHLTLKNYTQHNNGRLSDYNGGNGRYALWTGVGHNGTASVINPVLTGFPNNACYVARTPGTVDIIGGYLANNNVSDVRLSEGITVRGTTMELDTETYAKGPGQTYGGSDYNTRMVWGDARQEGMPGGLVTNCSFILRSYDKSGGLVAILENPHITVQNSQFLLNDEITAVNPNTGEITLTNCGFTGDAPATAGVGDITGTNNCVADNINPGTVPVNPHRKDCGKFKWERVHPLARPNGDCSD